MKYIDVRTASLDELAYAFTVNTATAQGYEALGLEVPETLKGVLKDIKREATERVRAEKEAKLSKAKARREAMRTPDEKRAALDADIAKLEAELA